MYIYIYTHTDRTQRRSLLPQKAATRWSHGMTLVVTHVARIVCLESCYLRVTKTGPTLLPTSFCFKACAPCLKTSSGLPGPDVLQANSQCTIIVV